jgi:hypothetical protein
MLSDLEAIKAIDRLAFAWSRNPDVYPPRTPPRRARRAPTTRHSRGHDLAGTGPPPKNGSPKKPKEPGFHADLPATVAGRVRVAFLEMLTGRTRPPS